MRLNKSPSIGRGDILAAGVYWTCGKVPGARCCRGRSPQRPTGRVKIIPAGRVRCLPHHGDGGLISVGMTGRRRRRGCPCDPPCPRAVRCHCHATGDGEENAARPSNPPLYRSARYIRTVALPGSVAVDDAGNKNNNETIKLQRRR